MANKNAGSPLLQFRWAGKQVRIDEVDSKLSALWKLSSDNMRTGANLHVRTSVLNLISCAPDIESAQRASKLLRDLSTTNLARATIVILDRSEGAPDAITSWITLRCFPMISDLMRHCFEQTTILLSGSATRSLNSTLPAVMKAHLPVYLWWIGDTSSAGDAIFHSISEMCQRIMVDSATFFQPEQDLRSLGSYFQKVSTAAISDLNWGRLTAWRQLIAQFFDVPEYLPFLAGIEQIEIEHTVAPLATPGLSDDGSVSPNPNGALLLAGWLKARLNMEVETASGQYHHDAASGSFQWSLNLPLARKPTIMQIRPHIQSSLHPGSLYLVRLACNAKNKRMVFTIKRDADSNNVLTSVKSSQQTYPTRVVHLPVWERESDLLRNELEIMGHDELFEHALQESVYLLSRE
jgi:glucose-6-phosphate dehydrogenase assembly protein OpcA